MISPRQQLRAHAESLGLTSKTVRPGNYRMPINLSHRVRWAHDPRHEGRPIYCTATKVTVRWDNGFLTEDVSVGQLEIVQ